MSAAKPTYDVALRAHWPGIAAYLAIGSAVCPRCLKVHTKCGNMHLRSPWSVTPRCLDCGEVLRLPEHNQPRRS